MYDDELKAIYKEAKKKAMENFNKVAVGDVKEEYNRQLKLKMAEKLQNFSTENERHSEQECYMFLNGNYETIAHKLRNQEYSCLEELRDEIKDFE